MENIKPLKIGPQVIALICTLIFLPFQWGVSVFKGLILGIADILIIALLIWWFSPLSFFYSLFIILIIKVLLITILDFKLTKETTATFFYSILNNMKHGFISSRFKKIGERTSASPKIKIGDKSYIVIAFETSLDPRREDKIAGHLILDYKTGEVIKDEELVEDILRTYNCWRHIYYNPILGKNVKKSSKPMIRAWIRFHNKFKEVIEKRISNNYEEISEIKNKEFIEILKKLDEEVINQNPYLIKKLGTELKIFSKIYDIFSKPSLESYQELINDIDFIAKMSQEENKVWTHRLNTWKKLCDYKDIEIGRLPEINFKRIGISIFGDLINYFLLKKKQHLIDTNTLATVVEEGSKKVKKEFLRFFNKYLVYHAMGINAIKKNIELNNNLKRVRDVYKQIWDSADLSKVRD